MAARPRKPVGDKRSYTLQIRLTAAEHKRFAKAAKANGLDTSTWCRMLMHKAAK